MPAASPEPQLRTLPRTDENVIEVQRLFAAVPQYFEAVQGTPAHGGEAEEEFALRPPDTQDEQVLRLGIFLGEELVGFTAVVNGYPGAAYAYVGLLLIPEERQRKGLGLAAWRKIEELIRSWPRVRTVRLGVADTTEAVGFWQKMGFHLTGRVRPCHQEHVTAAIIEMEKEI